MVLVDDSIEELQEAAFALIAEKPELKEKYRRLSIIGFTQKEGTGINGRCQHGDWGGKLNSSGCASFY